MSYDNSNSGFIGKNNRQREGKKDPELSGSCEVGGVQYWIKGWRNAKGYGLRFEPKEGERSNKKPRGPQSSPARQPEPAGELDEDEIPF